MMSSEQQCSRLSLSYATRNALTPTSKPRLLVLASTFPRWPDDPEPQFVLELSKRLTEFFDVTVLTPHAPSAATREIMDDVNVIRYRYAPARLQTLVFNGGIATNLQRSAWKWLLVPSFILMQALYAWRLIRREKIDVMHAHWIIPQGLIAAVLQKSTRRRLPFLVTSHGADLYTLNAKPLRWLKRYVIGKSSGVTTVSSAMLEQVHLIAPSAQRTAVIPMGVDLQERFTPDPSVPRMPNEILFVGRLVEKKGLTFLLEALPRILATLPRVQLFIVGFGPLEASLRKQVQELHLEANVTFLGAIPQDRLPELYRRAALFTAPFIQAESGDQEGLPVALMEAVACGCPVLAGDVLGIGDLLGSARKDVCVDAKNIKALADKVIYMLQNPAYAHALAQQIHRHASGYVDWQHIASQYAQQIYQAYRQPNVAAKPL